MMEWPSSRTLCLSIGCLVTLAFIEAWVFSQTERTKLIKILRVHLHIFIEVLIGLSVWYIWKRVTTVIRTKSVIALGFLFKLVILAVLSLSLVTMVIVLLPVSTDPHMLSFVSSFCFGAVIFLTTSLIISDILSFIFRRLSRLRHSTRPPSLSADRNEVKIRTLLALICALALVSFGTLGVNEITIERINVQICKTNNRIKGTTIVQLSDIHLGPFNGKNRLDEVVGKVNSLNADIVVITGDLVDASFESLRDAVSPLRQIKSKYGVYYITGNHEYYTGDVDNWLSGIRQYNITPLVNQRVCLLGSHDPKSSSCDDGLYLAGLEDIETRRMRYGSHSMDLHSALSGRTLGIPTIVLAHQPWAAAEAIMWDDVRLVLSGHTHGGQIFPMAPLVYLYNPFFAGLYEPRPGVFVYVNPGTLYYLIPFRHYYKPEITHITLI